MSTASAGERRLLAQDEYEPVMRSHYPALGGFARAELVHLARWLRERRNRVRDVVRARRRAHRARVPAAGAAPLAPDEGRGLSAKKQVFARALKRVNARLARLPAAEKRERSLAWMRGALERKGNAPVHHPQPGRTAGGGMQSLENTADMVQVEPGRVGEVSQAVRNAQARRDDARARAGA